MGTVDKIQYLAATFGVRKFYYGKQLFFFQNLGIAIPTGAPFKEHFNRVLARVIEAGIFAKWGKDEFFKITKYDGDEEGETKAITLTHLQAAFFVVLLGYVAAALALCVENIVAFFKWR
ncbi:uncharacterized protein [Macrobrachium rosenbergii]|uniref:uncharacterized protein n=1 Tax=Macrobrachium rosenbergii TaxID=79674 RepID=UPI0034D46C05